MDDLMTATVFDLREMRVANQLGLNQREVRALREKFLKSGVHFEFRKNRLYYALAAIPALREALGLSREAEAQKAAPASNGAEPEVKLEEMKLVKWNFINRQVVQCLSPDGATVVNVRVQDSKNFRPLDWQGKPMTLRVRREEGRFVHVGRCPRWPGKW